MLNSINMSIKLPVVIVSLCLFVGASISLSAFTQSRATLLEQAQVRLNLLMMERAAQLERWAKTLVDDMSGFGTDPTVQEAIIAFTNTYRLLPGDPTETLQQVYITDNPHSIGERDALVEPEVAHPYHMQHGALHPFFRHLKDTDAYYDIFLFNPDGDLIYSVYKEADFATNFINGPYHETGLGKVFKTALELEPGQLAIEDFAPYAPSAGAPAAFIATPVLGEWGDVIGVVAVQLPLGLMTEILDNDAGLEQSGEILAIGSNGLTRSGSRFAEGPDVLETFVSADRLAQFEAAPDTFLVGVDGYRGTDVVSLSLATDILGLGWRLVAEMDVSEVLEPTRQLRNIMFLIGVVGIGAAGVLGLLFAGSVTRPLSRLGSAMAQVSNRETNVEVKDTERADEIGTIAQTLVAFRDKLEQADRLEEVNKQQAIDQKRVVEKLSIALNSLAEGDLTQKIDTPFAKEFEQLRSNYNRSITHLSGTITTLIDNAANIRTGAHDIATSSNELLRRTENQAATLEETAAALDELTSSVKSAASGAKEVETVVNEAKSEATDSAPIVQSAVAAMTEIKGSSEAISQIIGVINDIAFQTNLLALNAGVEAARAGEAGQGFAVVASEVRALAQRSTDASRQIKNLIDGSSAHVSKGAELVDQAGMSLTRILERVTHISELTTEIASNAIEQSTSLGEINIGVSSLDKVTQQNAAMVETTTNSSRSLNEGAAELSEVARHFKITGAKDVIRAA